MIALVLALALGTPASTPAGPQASAPAIVDRGIRVAFDWRRDAAGPAAGTATFRLTNTATDTPITGVRPAAWLALRREGAPRSDCAHKASRFLSADLFSRADADLNSYYVLALNDDASISVVDPLFGFGGSKLLTTIVLESRGEDWALTRDRLFVSMPAANAVAVADTRTWKVVKTIATGANPRRVVASETHVFVGDDGGVTKIEVATLAVTRMDVGKVMDLVVGDRDVFVATDRGVFQQERRLGPPQSILAYSNAAKRLYAADTQTGAITIIDPAATQQPSNPATINAKPGLTKLRFAPNGRHALIVNPRQHFIQVLDAATNRIVQNGEIADAPDDVAFSDLLVYLRRRDSPTVLMIPLEEIGAEGKPLGVADFPGGQHAFGKATSLADGIVEAPDGPAVLVANARDKMIYYYKEGMAAPMGGFSNYGRQPRAVLVVDRGLREGAAGTYATNVAIKKPGTYDVVFFLDSPRVITCFSMTVDGEQAPPTPRVVALDKSRTMKAGDRASIRFAITGARQANDVRALVFQAPGVWQQRGEAKALGDGTYEWQFVPPSSGIYYVWVESESLGLAKNNPQFMVYEAVASE